MKYHSFFLFFFFWLHHATWKVLVYQPGIKPRPLHGKRESLFRVSRVLVTVGGFSPLVVAGASHCGSCCCCFGSGHLGSVVAWPSCPKTCGIFPGTGISGEHWKLRSKAAGSSCNLGSPNQRGKCLSHKDPTKAVGFLTLDGHRTHRQHCFGQVFPLQWGVLSSNSFTAKREK